MGNSNDERLAEIERTQERILVLLEGLASKVAEQQTADRDWRKAVDLRLHGDGNGNRGMFVRLDRLEQSQERSRWALRAVVTAVLALLGKLAADLLAR